MTADRKVRLSRLNKFISIYIFSLPIDDSITIQVMHPLVLRFVLIYHVVLFNILNTLKPNTLDTCLHSTVFCILFIVCAKYIVSLSV